MSNDPATGVPAWKLLARGLLARCPACGSGKLFSRAFKLKPRCPRCRWDFDREPGWWIGAMVMNIGAAIALFGLYFPLSLIITWPDVPWTLIAVVGCLLMALFPIAFYPISKTLWLAMDVLLHRMG
jgi:uncharacterized protein (DUF983 family)